MKILEAITKHPIVAIVLFGATLIGVVGSYADLWKTIHNAWQNHFHPTSYEGELCDIQHSACEAPSAFKQVIEKKLFSTVRFDFVLVSPPSMGACEPSFQEFYDETLWHPISLDTNPQDGCDKEILVSKSAMIPLTVTGGATYHRIEGEFSIVHIDATSGPLGFTALIEK
ncbi:hypothetical protein [Thiomicrorhabdus sp.]|uniref:hypothetical protein n=1 Tax=Thiomicrorhabdus sp. TaxID=2039724 RepID=UPI0029C8D1DC|nr:hypothetical protein [Thiomicrorhabdus sp.]